MTAPEVAPELPAAELLAQHFDEAFSAPDGITRLRELILTLAMQGKLVEQDPSEGTAAELLEQIAAEKKRLVKEGKIKAPKPLPAIEDEEKPYELPQGWAWVRLGEIASYIQRGKGPKYTEERLIPVISQKCVQWRGFDKDVVRFIEPKSLAQYGEERLIRNGDLLWNSTGTGTIGRVCLYRDELSDFEAVVADSHVTVVRLLLIDHDYALQFLKSPFVQDRIESSASGTTNQIELNTSTVVEHLLPLPPLAEQRRIVARIDQLMARCDELEALREQQEAKRVQTHRAVLREVTAASDPAAFAEGWRFLADHFGELHATPKDLAELRGAILQLAVMGKLVPQDASEGTAAELLEQIQAEKRGLAQAGKIRMPKPLPPVTEAERPHEIPQGWVWIRLNEIGIWKSGSTPSRTNPDFYGGAIPWVKSGEVKQGRIVSTEESVTRLALDKCSLNLNPIGSVLVAMYGANIGEVGVLDIEATTNQAVCACQPFPGIEQNYLLSFITAMKPNFVLQGAGAAQPNISREKIVATPFPLPPLAEQRRIVAKVDQLMGLCDVLQERLTAQGIKQGQLLGAVMAQLAPSVAVSRPAATAGSGRRGRPSAAAAAPEGSGGEKRGRGRPRKAAGAEPARSIPQASSEADAIRKLEALRLERAQGDKLVGLFEE